MCMHQHGNKHMSNERITDDITETAAQLGSIVLFDIAEVAAQCNDTCDIKWCEDSEAYVLRSRSGVPLFLFEAFNGCVDAVKQ